MSAERRHALLSDPAALSAVLAAVDAAPDLTAEQAALLRSLGLGPTSTTIKAGAA